MTTTHDPADLAWGDVEPAPVSFVAGPWRADVRGDEVADIRYRGVTVLRSVRAVLRDRDWNTVPVAVTGSRAVQGGLELELSYRGYGADLAGLLRLYATGDELVVQFSGHNRRDFLRCRAGLVVLHPSTLAGTPFEVGHSDGTRTRTAFPVAVSPHQPAMGIADLSWSTEGVRSELAFEGEVFEMEDQRNWTDASYKTYGTPLALPFPVTLAAGERIHQRVVLRCHGIPRTRPRDTNGARLVGTGALMPELAVGAATGPTAPHVAGLPTTRLVELELHDPAWRAALDRAADEVADGELDVRLVARAPEDLVDALDAVAGFAVARLGVYSAATHVSEPALWRALREGAARRGLRAALVGGTRAHYTELNRERHRLPPDIPAHTFSLTPQMHAVERAQLVESIAMIRVVVEDAISGSAGRPVHVGPITLRPRFNAVATSPPPANPGAGVSRGYGPEHVVGATDPRQFSRAAGAWFAAAVAAAAVPGVASITVAESFGDRGFARPGIPESPGLVAVRAIARLAGNPLLSAVGLPPGVAAVGVVDGSTVRVVASNLNSEPVGVPCRFDLPTGAVTRALEILPWDVSEIVVA